MDKLKGLKTPVNAAKEKSAEAVSSINLERDFSYRISTVVTPTSIYGSPLPRTPLNSEDYHSCLNKTSDSLVDAMDDLQIISEKKTRKNSSRPSLTPFISKISGPKNSSTPWTATVKITDKTTAEKISKKPALGNLIDLSEIQTTDSPIEIEPKVKFAEFVVDPEKFNENTEDNETNNPAKISVEIHSEVQSLRPAVEAEIKTENNSFENAEKHEKNTRVATAVGFQSETKNSSFIDEMEDACVKNVEEQRKMDSTKKLNEENSGFVDDNSKYKKNARTYIIEKLSDGIENNEEIASTSLQSCFTKLSNVSEKSESHFDDKEYQKIARTYVIQEVSETRESEEIGIFANSEDHFDDKEYKKTGQTYLIQEVSETRENREEIGESSKDNFVDANLVFGNLDEIEAEDKRNEKQQQGKKSRVLTSQVRRQSLKYRRRSGQFVSMAEAILKFQKGTPKRFRSTSVKDQNAKVEKSKTVRALRKTTCPMSPALRCKSRARPTTFPNREERERLEIEEIRRNRCKSSQPKKKTKKQIATSETSTSNLPAKKNDSNLLSAVVAQKSVRKATPRRKTLVKSVSSTEQGPLIRDVEIFDFGVPIQRKKTVLTNPLPFSFEKREKKNQEDKKNSESARNEEEMNKRKTILQRSAASATVTSGALAKSSGRSTGDDCAKKSSWSTFQERNERVISKKRETANQLMEREKQARVFHAKPAPILKPVLARGTSTENLRIVEKKEKIRGLSPASRTRGLSPARIPDQENREPNISSNNECPKLKIPLVDANEKPKKVSPQPPFLSTDERSRKRQEFDAMIRRKEEAEEERRREDESDRLAREKNEDKELRKTLEWRARPMPVYKHPKIAKSSKPLTEPQSPARSRKKINKKDVL